MKISHFIKLITLVVAFSLLPLHTSFAGCGCEERDYQQDQEENDLKNSDPSRD